MPHLNKPEEVQCTTVQYTGMVIVGWTEESWRGVLVLGNATSERCEIRVICSDIFRHLIVDPGDLKWEQTCPGALYVALSRAKTMGTYTTDTSFSQDSAIYW